VQALAGRSAPEVTVTALVPERPPLVVETAAYFVAAESITNATKHAPGAAVRVTIAESGDKLIVSVSDDGPGGADPHGAGLTGLRQRVEALDGTFRVTSPEGGPTVVSAELPCAS
jgi:signal transduction histidine kinase